MFKKLTTPIISVLDFITKYFKTFVFLFIVVLIMASSHKPTQTPNLAKIYLKGTILDSENLRLQIEEIKKYPSIKGALLIIDSPGGAAGASIEIADLIKDLTKSMPVVTHTESTMTSGAYYAGIYASRIYANRGSLVGHIGVIFNGANIQDLIKKLGIQSQTLSAGEFKEAGALMTRAWSEKEKKYMQQVINNTYDMFVLDVANARKLNIADSHKFAQGQIFNAKKAKDLGLIDGVCSRDEAISTLKDLSGVTQAKWLEKTRFETYMESLMQSSMGYLFGIFGLGSQQAR